MENVSLIAFNPQCAAFVQSPFASLSLSLFKHVARHNRPLRHNEFNTIYFVNQNLFETRFCFRHIHISRSIHQIEYRLFSSSMPSNAQKVLLCSYFFQIKESMCESFVFVRLPVLFAMPRFVFALYHRIDQNEEHNEWSRWPTNEPSKWMNECDWRWWWRC